MAPVSDYSTTPADNTTISGLAVSDATVVSTIDDIVRQLMADIRSADDANMKLTGDQTATGTKSFATVVAGFGRITTASASRLDFQATSVADTHERTRLVRDTTAFRQQTASSDASSTVDDYIATVGATGVSSHQWNVAGTKAFTVQGTSGDTEVQVSGTSASVRLIETDGTSGYRQTLIGHFADAFQIQTRNSSGTLVSTDYVATKGASGVSAHSWRVNGSEALNLNTGGLRTQAVIPLVDNTSASGDPSFRWTAVYAVNGTIQTSDQREKQDVAFLTEAEERLALRLKGLIRTYRWKSDPAKKHFGVIAQEVIEAFEAENLDWTEYGVISGGGDEPYGVNYAELHSLILGV